MNVININDVQCGAKVACPSMLRVLPPVSSDVCATLCVEFSHCVSFNQYDVSETVCPTIFR